MTVQDQLPALPRGRRAMDIYAAEVLAQLRNLNQTMTEQAARVAGRMVNNVIHVATYLFVADAAGATPSVTIDCRVAAGSIDVVNLAAANVVTVAAGPPMAYAPPSGIGVGVVLGASHRTLAIGGRQITLYGTAGDRVSVQVFATAIEPSS